MVYVLLAPHCNAIKIGVATDVTRRVKSPSTAHPYPLKLLGTIKGGRDLERALHRRFQEYRLGGEWFEATPELQEAVQQLVNGNLGDCPTAYCRREGKTVVCGCPFCGEEHIHGTGGLPGPDFGHRLSHCGEGGYQLVLES